MTYRVEYKPEAVRELRRLDHTIAVHIKEKRQKIKANPARHVKFINTYNVFCLRVGDIRVFLDQDANKKVISILTIRHRSKAYRGWK